MMHNLQEKTCFSVGWHLGGNSARERESSSSHFVGNIDYICQSDCNHAKQMLEFIFQFVDIFPYFISLLFIVVFVSQ